MPQMSPMNWIMLCSFFLIMISILKSSMMINQKNETQKSSVKTSLKNNIKW